MDALSCSTRGALEVLTRRKVIVILHLFDLISVNLHRAPENDK